MVYIEFFILSLSIIVPLLIAVAFFTLSERKLMSSIQRRTGPNVVGDFAGMLQPFADGLKLIFKETLLPTKAYRFIFVAAPGYTFFLSLIPWITIPFSETLVLLDLFLGLIFLFTINSLGAFGVLLAGWASNSYYAYFGSIRAIAQIISYELVLSIVAPLICVFSGSYNLIDIVITQKTIWFIIPLFPIFIIFAIIILVETNRSPADLPESESELVAGYIVDYSAIGFAMFFLGEYSNMLIMSSLLVVLFLGGWLIPKFGLDFYYFDLIFDVLNSTGDFFYLKAQNLTQLKNTLFDFSRNLINSPILEARLHIFKVSNLGFSCFFLFTNIDIYDILNNLHKWVYFIFEMFNEQLVSLFLVLYSNFDIRFLQIAPQVVFTIKVIMVAFYFIWIRASLPRLRFDFLMNLGWKIFLPFAFSFFFFAVTLLIIFEGVPLKFSLL